MSFEDGFRAFGRLMVSGPDALAKARKVAEAFWECAGGKALYADAREQFVGWDSCHAPLAKDEPGEVLVQFAVRDADERKINARFGPQLVPRVLGTVPGITYLADQGRPRASDVVGYWPALISRKCVKQRVIVGGEEAEVAQPDLSKASARPFLAAPVEAPFTPSGKRVRVPLARLCLARSGDKGDTANVGVIARSDAIFAWMRQRLTAAFVKRRFEGVCRGKVERAVVPNLRALNFLLHESLGGGGTLSLLLDAQGKTYAQYLLAAKVTVDAALLEGLPA